MARVRSRAQADRLTRLLRKLPDRVQEAIQAPIADYAEAVLQGARSRVPQRYRHTGQLRKAITKRIAKDGLTARVGVLSKRGKESAFYAHFVEFGTRPHSIAKGGATKRGARVFHRPHPGAKAHPFLFPAAEAAKNPFIAEMNKAVRQALEDATRD